MWLRREKTLQAKGISYAHTHKQVIFGVGKEGFPMIRLEHSGCQRRKEEGEKK